MILVQSVTTPWHFRVPGGTMLDYCAPRDKTLTLELELRLKLRIAGAVEPYDTSYVYRLPRFQRH